MAMNPRLLVPRATGYVSPDADARAYLAAVRIADGSNLEPAVAKAISDFVIGCKTDGIWDAIKASCILCGAKTLSGALVPLKGSTPTNVNNNFVSGDYNRKTGLVGNGSNKSIDSGRNNNADGQNDKHIAVYVTTASSSNASGAGSFPVYIGRGGATSGTSVIGRLDNNSANLFSRHHNGGADIISSAGTATGLIGSSRSGSANYTFRHSGASSTVTRASQTPFNGNISVFEDFSIGGSGSASFGRLAFYSIGSAVDLALLDSRVSALYTAIGAAI
jgi:hypothetical protein